MTQNRVFRSTVSTVRIKSSSPCSSGTHVLTHILPSPDSYATATSAGARYVPPWANSGQAMRHLVGKCHGHDLEGSSRQEPREPGIFLRVLHGAPQDGMRADDENASQIAVTLLGDRPELLLAPGRILSRHQPNPSRKIASGPKHCRVRYRRDDRSRPDDA